MSVRFEPERIIFDYNRRSDARKLGCFGGALVMSVPFTIPVMFALKFLILVIAPGAANGFLITRYLFAAAACCSLALLMFLALIHVLRAGADTVVFDRRAATMIFKSRNSFEKNEGLIALGDIVNFEAVKMNRFDDPFFYVYRVTLRGGRSISFGDKERKWVDSDAAETQRAMQVVEATRAFLAGSRHPSPIQRGSF